MFVVKKNTLNVKHDRKEKRMATVNTKPANEVGIIGQMYEDRKTKKVGVLESRETKYKTLMMRDADGKSFNITYSTFKSNWRKYQGEEQIQTSTQIEEKKVEEEKKAQKAKAVVEKKEPDVAKISTEEKVKKVRALDELICSKIEKAGYSLKTARTGRGCVIVRHGKKSLFEIWIKFGYELFDMIALDDIVAQDREKFNKVIEQSEYTYKEKWHLKHLCRVKQDDFDGAVDTLLEMANKFVAEKEKSKEEN